MNRRRAVQRLAALVGGGMLGSGRFASASSTPACPALEGARIRWLVGWSAGGGYDSYSRLLEPVLEAELGAQIVIENLPGGGGLMAARRIAEAKPDGRILGILNGPGLLIAPFSNPGFAPDLRSDFTVLGRLAPHAQVLFVARRSGIQTLDALLDRHQSKPLVVADTGAGTINLLLSSLLEDLFGVHVEHVLGFPGSREVRDALSRGWVDAAVTSVETGVSDPALVPLLRFDEGNGAGSTGQSVPSLGGAAGLIVERPGLFVDPDRAGEDVAAVVGLCDVGRLLAAPPGLPRALEDCLKTSVASVLSSGEFRNGVERLGRPLVPATADVVAQSLDRAIRARDRFGEIVERTILRIRG